VEYGVELQRRWQCSIGVVRFGLGGLGPCVRFEPRPLQEDPIRELSRATESVDEPSAFKSPSRDNHAAPHVLDGMARPLVHDTPAANDDRHATPGDFRGEEKAEAVHRVSL
jgi:hypothetical protein